MKYLSGAVKVKVRKRKTNDIYKIAFIALQQSSFHLTITCQTLSSIGWFHSQHLSILCSSFFLSYRVFQFLLIFLLSSVLHIFLNFLSFFSGKALWPLGAATMQGRRWKGRKPKLQIVNVLKLYIVPLYHCKYIIDTLYHAFEIVIVSIWYNVQCPRNCKLNHWYIVPCSQKCKCINDTLYHAFKIHWL